jgi:hypothetical protein
LASVSGAIGRLQSAVLLIGIMFLGSLALWVGVPVAWLWVGSQVQAGTSSLAVAIGAMMAGMILTIIALVAFLASLNRRYVELSAARGNEVRALAALETVLVGSAAIALVVFVVWFFGFSGSSPIPVEIKY